MSERLALHLLGSPQLYLDDAPVNMDRRKAVALLMFLAIEQERHQRATLSGLFWPDYDQSKAFTNLRHTLWEIQQSIGGDWLIADRETIGINNKKDVWLDVHQFESLLSQSRIQKNISLRIPLFVESTKLYRNHLLTGFSLKDAPTFNDWMLAESEDLRYQLADALTLLSQDYCSLGEIEKAIPHARRLITLDPLNESAHRQLMQIYVEAGQQSEALKQYQICEQVLRKELNLDPQPETFALYKKIRKGNLKTIQGERQPGTLAPKHNLPSQLSSFVGREKEHDEITSLLEINRLVTLTGVGGIGKTRLSLRVAPDLLEQFTDGVWFIELAPVSDPDLIPQTILTTLGLSDRSGQGILKMLQDFLHEKKVLLLLDNCEHLIQACANVTNTLLKAAPKLKIFATSREALGVEGEALYPVPSLSMPDPEHLPDIEQLSDFEAVRLFVERARLGAPHFILDKANAAFIAQICHCLDGIPLAIELAASRVKVLSPEQIASRLDDRFRLLTSGFRTALPRQQTLRATVDWSYNLLSEQEKTLFRRLVVFVGGWSMEAAETVCSGEGIETKQILDLMTQLVNKSLVIVENVQGESRYHTLETIRQYAREKLSETTEFESLRDRHLNFYLTLAEELEPRWKTAERIVCKKQLEVEHDNFRAALGWALIETKYIDAEKGMRLACALMKFWHHLAYFREGRAWLERGLALLAEGGFSSTVLYARALDSIGYLANFQGDFDFARQKLEESIALYRRMESFDPRWLAEALYMLAWAIANATDDLSLPRALTDESIQICRALGPEGIWDLAEALYWNGHIAFLQRDYEKARCQSEESRALYRQSGSVWDAAGSTGTLGSIAVCQKQYSAARAYYAESLRLFRAVGDSHGIAALISLLADMDYLLGDYEAASKRYRECLNMWREMGNKGETSENLLNLGLAVLHFGDFEHAGILLKESLPLQRNARQDPRSDFYIGLNLAGLSELARKQNDQIRAAWLLGAAEAVVASMGALVKIVSVRNVDKYESLITAGHAQLDMAAWLDGQAMPLEQVIEFSLKDGNE